MSNKERLKALEDRVQKLEAELALLRAQRCDPRIPGRFPPTVPSLPNYPPLDLTPQTPIPNPLSPMADWTYKPTHTTAGVIRR